ncbi:hypothetical protein CDAR_14261 [Caerostris darwini]|uniref:Uncharacterized protein n=1 Tax=Caerostris darwini TaxID=1538125 RepID=A0AAV4QFE3_9ARAC|nr:hypothetical protein CDAR_14261 [Caerostris darwini]
MTKIRARSNLGLKSHKEGALLQQSCNILYFIRDKPHANKKRAYRENKCVCCWRQRKSDSSGRDNSSRRGTKRAEGVGVAKMYQLENQKRVTIDENCFRLLLC